MRAGSGGFYLFFFKPIIDFQMNLFSLKCLLERSIIRRPDMEKLSSQSTQIMSPSSSVI